MTKFYSSWIYLMAYWVGFVLLSSCVPAYKIPVELQGTGGETGDLETLVLLGTNDIHGGLASMDLKTRETGQPSLDYQAGGVAFLATYVKILREEFGNHFVWLDAGDEFQGTIDSNLEQGAPMVAFFNKMGLNAAAIGNHEFDFGVDALKLRMSEAKYPYLAANIRDKNTGRLAAFPNTIPSTILRAGRLKIGVIGLSTLDTPTTTRPDHVKDYRFQELNEATVHEAHALKEAGANIVVIVAHVGLRCSPGKKSPAYSFRRVADPQGECEESGEMVQFLKKLPSGTVDAVVSGHSHQVVHHWVAGIPVIQGGSFGRFANVMYLTYDWSRKKLAVDRTLIEGPIPVCPKIFANQGDCNGERPAPKEGRGNLTTVHFHGKSVHSDSEIENLLEPYLKKSEMVKKQVVGIAVRPVDHERFKESELGNLVADAIRATAKTDFALTNSGGIRAPLESGPITYETLFRSLPFDNAIATLKLTGQEVKTLLRIAESGSRGFAPTSGVHLKVMSPEIDAPSKDLNGNGKIEPWEINRLLDVHTSDDSTLHDNQTYTVGTIDFLVVGGDDLGWFMSQIPQDRIQLNTGGVLRDAVVKYLAQVSPINSPENPLVDPANPRLKFVKTTKLGKKRGRRRRK